MATIPQVYSRLAMKFDQKIMTVVDAVASKEYETGRKANLLIPGSQLGLMDGIASVCHQHDIL